MDKIQIIIKFNETNFVVKEFSDIEVQITGLEMPSRKGLIPSIHPFVDWLLDGALNDVCNKPLFVCEALIAKAKSLGWYEANGEQFYVIDPYVAVQTITQFPEYKSREEIDQENELLAEQKEIAAQVAINQEKKRKEEEIKNIINNIKTK